MDASGQSDPDLPGDWTFVPSEDELMEVPDAVPRHGGSQVEDLPLDENASNVTREQAMEIKEEKGHDTAAGRDGEVSAGSRDSDIDIIDEDTDHSLESLSSSAIANSSTSLMGFSDISSGTVSSYGNLEAPSALDAASVASDMSLPSGLELQSGVRRYKHVPNTRLNWALTVMAALVAVAAIAFGVGHYLGGSEPPPLQQPEMIYSHVKVLKRLQEGLMQCLLEQSENTLKKDGPAPNPHVCYQDAEHWKEKFEQVFSENKGLKELLEHSQRNAVMHDPRLDTSDDCAVDSPQDVHKLKLDLILNQMQHLQLMKTFNQVKNSERLSREQARKLELENEQLKARLEEEEADELLVQQELEAKVQTLTEENQELQSRLGHESQREAALRSLEHQVQQLQNENELLKRSMQEQVPSSVTTSRISVLRDKVNRLIGENEDLKAVVARLRYGPPPSVMGEPASDQVKGDDQSEKKEADEAKEVDAHAPEGSESQLSDLLDALRKQQADSKQWRRLYDELRRSNREGSSATGGSKSVWRKMLTMGQMLFDDMQAGLDHTLDALVQLASKGSSVASHISPVVQDLGQKVRRKLNRRRAELNGYLDGSGNGADSVSQTMRLLESSVKKVFEAGRKFVSKGQEATGKHAEKLVSKLAKVAQRLSSDWEGPFEQTTEETVSEPTTTDSPLPSKDELKDKGKNGKVGKGEAEREEDCCLGNGAKRNGKDSEKCHQQNEKAASDKPAAKKKRLLDAEEQEEEDWFITRAKDRERQRTEASSGNENWFLKRRAWQKGGNGATTNRFKARAERKASERLFRDHESFLYDEEEFPE